MRAWSALCCWICDPLRALCSGVFLVQSCWKQVFVQRLACAGNSLHEQVLLSLVVTLLGGLRV